MKHERMRHYLLDEMEAELLACYRSLNEQSKVAFICLLASQVGQGCQKLDVTVDLRIISE